MKKIQILFFLILFYSCKSEEPVKDNELVGTWRLVSRCMSDDNNPCVEEILPSNKFVYVSFQNGRTFIQTYKNTIPKEYCFWGGTGGGYEIEGQKIRIYSPTSSSSGGQLFDIDFKDSQKLKIKTKSNLLTSSYIFTKE